jgi:hypothetical protein
VSRAGKLVRQGQGKGVRSGEQGRQGQARVKAGAGNTVKAGRAGNTVKPIQLRQVKGQADTT